MFGLTNYLRYKEVNKMTNITGINAATLLAGETVTTATQTNNNILIIGLGALALLIYLKTKGGK